MTCTRSVPEALRSPAVSTVQEVIPVRKLRSVSWLALAAAVSVLLLAAPAQAGTWTKVQGGNIHYHSVDFVDATHGWVGGVTYIPPGQVGFEDTASIGRTSTAGSSWLYANSHQAGDVSFGWNFLTAMTLDFINGSLGWAALSDGTIVATTNGGADWVLQAEGSFEFRDNNWGYSSLSMARS